MVFGWGKKKSENQVKVEPKEQQITIEQIPSIVDDIKEIRRKTLIAEINNFGAKINPNLEELIKIAKELEKDDLNVDDQTYIVNDYNDITGRYDPDPDFDGTFRDDRRRRRVFTTTAMVRNLG